MKVGNRDTCRHCGTVIMICRLRGGKWLPFDLDMVRAGPDVVEAYVPVRVDSSIALLPIADVAPRQLEGVRWFAKQHRCAEFMRVAAAKRQDRLAKRDQVDALGDSLAEHFATNWKEPDE